MTRVIIAEDQKLLRESFKNIIENNSDIKVVACATNGNEAYDLCKEYMPDVVLMDLSMPICNGTEATKLIKAELPSVKVLVLTASNDKSDVTDAISNGADGYILKDISTEELILSIKSISLGLGIITKDILSPMILNLRKENKKAKKKIIDINGINISLTERELKIVSMIVDGKDNKEIASSLFIAEGTVKNIITEIISKLSLRDRTQLAVYAVKNGLV
ncbi:response regulator [Clostridium beijerinckii]|jgi:Response regulator containing a CheY-like receiver domain and an HTH DNA-binding domain|uniref:Stage 0 sporulation protein A homolog n=2 Tax=Clostridium beijerinckii TaxID=1520 RepID=A0A1S8QYN3_CLOBE|nr:response regulator transcription factor [Clostridium beijerinckii]ABR36932.1 two component transcriptional regulator, LuxR family [Clostridium beijerinckii NCIMB 8052]AIU03583.1 two component LuxR family transcriptional regulator [Clostridium beijerinckii ATCC 35702]MBF7808421.1 response regulator transcription factor [Clostridium beijerinckii]NOW88878.1 DNA-binding NarL/FixJ family response regulator [Clostridium beijerinckii]NRT21990.1 DNA-binding NarL/FixJ family response regulator [Clos